MSAFFNAQCVMFNGEMPHSVRHDGRGGVWEKLVLSSEARNLFVT